MTRDYESKTVRDLSRWTDDCMLHLFEIDPTKRIVSGMSIGFHLGLFLSEYKSITSYVYSSKTTISRVLQEERIVIGK